MGVFTSEAGMEIVCLVNILVSNRIECGSRRPHPGYTLEPPGELWKLGPGPTPDQ